MIKPYSKKVSIEDRWNFWRECGIAVGDAPLDYRTGDELDALTDEHILRNRKQASCTHSRLKRQKGKMLSHCADCDKAILQ